MPDRSWWHAERLAQRLPLLAARGAVRKAASAYFQAEGFLEVETPAVQISPGMERHIRPFGVALHEPFSQVSSTRYLHTSPEFAMKKLLAGGMTKIVQMARVWRDGERSALHEPEFTMLEWYRAGADYHALIDDCAAVLRTAAKAAARTLENDPILRWNERTCDPALPIRRLTVAQAFHEYTGIDVLATIADTAASQPDPSALRAAARATGIAVGDSDSWEDVFFHVMLDRIEPHLGIGAPCVLTEYPTNLAALARRKPGDPRVAERFELYACGVELANAYSELTDPQEQRIRFEADRALHVSLYGSAPPVDEELLAALGALGDCAGIALGFDRLVMLATGASKIADVLWAPVE